MGIGVGELSGRLWRACGACLAMVGCLNAMDMAWVPATATGTWSVAADLLGRCGIGAVAYTATAAGLWYLAGRPDGAERYLLRVGGKLAAKSRISGMVRR